MSQRSKKHHFVPKVLQKAFRSRPENPTFVWYSEKGEDGTYSRPVEKMTDKTFVIANYYSVLGVEDCLSDVVEREYYGQIDAYLGKVLPKIFAVLSAGEIPTFVGEPKDSLIEVVFEMVKRTPDFTKDYNDTDIGKEIIEASIAQCADLPEHQLEKRRLLNDLGQPEKIKNLGRSTRVKAVIMPSPEMAEVLSKFSVR